MKDFLADPVTRNSNTVYSHSRRFPYAEQSTQPALDRGKKETVGQKTCGGNQCPNIMPLPHNESRTVHNRHEPASSANAPGQD